MTPTTQPPYAGHPAPRTGGQTLDVGISVALLVLAWIGLAGCAFLSLFLVAFADGCSTPGCSVESFALSIIVANLVAVVGAVVGTVVTSVAIARRRHAWPWALGTLLLVVAAYVGGAFVAYGQI